MRRIILFLFFIAWKLSLSQAELSQPVRWEVENKFTEDAYSIVSLNENGLALVKDLEKYDDGKKKWELIILDTSLREQWKTELELHTDLRFTGYEYLNGRLNLMFRRNSTDVLLAEMLWIDLSSHEIKQSSIDVKLQIRLTHYTVSGNNCVFGGYVSREPVLLIHDPDKNNTIIVPGFFLTDTELMDVRPNANETFNIVLFQRTITDKKIIFRTINNVGSILVEDEIPIDDEKTILSAVTSMLEHDEVLIGGAFAYKNDKQATGIFSCMIDPFANQSVQYVELPILKHFLDYLPEKKAKKVRDKSNERTNYNKPLNFHTNINVHRVEEFKNGFALFGESFIASTASATNMYTGPYHNQFTPFAYTPYASRYYNNPYLYPAAPVIEEMRMQGGFVIGFDFKGRRVWDYSIPMDELKIPGRDQVSDFMVVKNAPYFIYKDDNELKFAHQPVDTSRISNTSIIPIKLQNEGEQAKPKEDALGNVRYWYDNFFYVWGIQSIRQRDRRDLDSSRRVFFINKIQVE